ncbi:hypothetical protein [Mammaliicoccus sciuri]|uniref:hypothetical protein n=1 Tax=Mammaliicoccus sciuri TaxID=1296 RepID=UPI003ADD591F
MESIKHYQEIEFGREEEDNEKVFDSNLECPLAYTTKGDNEEFEIQVTLELRNKKITKELSCEYGYYIENVYYNSLKEMADDFVYLNFDDLILTEVDEDKLFIRLKKEWESENSN